MPDDAELAALSTRSAAVADRRRLPSLVPTPGTRALAERMLTDRKGTAYDAALRHLPKLEPGQTPALVGILLANARRPRNMNLGRRPAPYRYTLEERRAGKAAWKRGERSQVIEDQRREYDRWAQDQARRRRGQAARAPLSEAV